MSKQFGKVQGNNESRYILIPSDFVYKHGIKKGDFLEREISGNSITFKVLEDKNA